MTSPVASFCAFISKQGLGLECVLIPFNLCRLPKKDTLFRKSDKGAPLL